MNTKTLIWKVYGATDKWNFLSENYTDRKDLLNGFHPEKHKHTQTISKVL